MYSPVLQKVNRKYVFFLKNLSGYIKNVIYICGVFQNYSITMRHLSIVAGLVVRHGDLSHQMTLSHKGHRPECDNVN